MEVDVQCVVQALKILSSDDSTTAAIACAELHVVVRQTTSSNPTVPTQQLTLSPNSSRAAQRTLYKTYITPTPHFGLDAIMPADN